MKRLEGTISFVLTLLRREHWWGEFWCSAVGMLGWSLINFLTPADYASPSRSSTLVEIMPLPMWSLFIGSFAILHVIGLMADYRLLRILAASALLWAVMVIGIGILEERSWTPGVAIYGALVGVYFSAIVYQVALLVMHRRRKVLIQQGESV